MGHTRERFGWLSAVRRGGEDGVRRVTRLEGRKELRVRGPLLSYAVQRGGTQLPPTPLNTSGRTTRGAGEVGVEGGEREVEVV